MSLSLAKWVSSAVLGLNLICFALALNAQSAWKQEGVASYYADYFHGRRTASGERYDRNLLTAAHRTLPFGTKLEVTNLKSEKTVYVTVTDRGPYGCGRIIDLSYAAAERLDLVRSGLARVRITQVDSIPPDTIAAPPPPVIDFRPQLADKEPPALNLPEEAYATVGSWNLEGQKLDELKWGVQVGSFQQLINALDLGRRARDNGFEVFVQVVINGTSRSYRVVLGNFESVQTARESVEQIVAAQLPAGFPVRHL